MILLTGGLGFIGSALLKELNDRDRKDVIIVDSFGDGDKWLNVRDLVYEDFMQPLELFENLEIFEEVDQIFHIGANSSTTESDMDHLWENNVDYSKAIFQMATEHNIKLCYASSAATYGSGDRGFSDKAKTLRPINKYGYSKYIFDRWALNEKQTPEHWYGLKYFNVFGPNEYHKGGMRSMVKQAHEQIHDNGEVKLFKSYHPDYKDGEQLRDFIYVKDVCRAMIELMSLEETRASGIYNLGTGQAKTWLDLVRAVFKALNKEEKIQFIEMPEKLKNQYQYFTEAEMAKFHHVLPDFKFTGLEEAVEDYVKNYLEKDHPYLSYEL